MSLVSLAVAIPLLAAALLASIRVVAGRSINDSVAFVGAVATLGIDIALARHAGHLPSVVAWFGGWKPAGGFTPGIAFVADFPAAVIATLGAVLATASLAFSSRYFDESSALFNVLVLVFLAAVQGYLLSGDLFTLFVFFELMATAAYALTGHRIETNSLEGAIGFAVINSIGAFFLLWGLALLYAKLGGLNLAWLGQHLAAARASPAYVGTAYALIATGFLVKGAIVPFHFWHADADAVAPTPVCVLISGVMAELGLVGLARVTMTVFAPALGPVHLVALGHALLYPLGVATALVGALMCVRQRHIKRLLAFSTIGHVGLMLCGLAAFNEAGLGGAGLYLVAHGLVKSALFLAGGVLLAEHGSIDEVALFGRGRHMRWTSILFLLGAAGLAGLPPFGTFAAKTLLEHSRMPGFTALFVAVEALTAAAVLRVSLRIFFGLGERPEEGDEPTTEDGKDNGGIGGAKLATMLASAGILLVLAAFLTAWPEVRGSALGAARLFLDTGAYDASVLGGAALGPAAPLPAPDWESSVPLSLATFAIALGLALAAIYANRLGTAVRRAWKAGPDRLLALLETIHSGHLGDYTAWLAAGFGAIAARLSLLLW